MPDFIWIQNVVFPILGMGMATFFGWQILRMINSHLERKARRLSSVEVEGLRHELDQLRQAVESNEDMRRQLTEVEERLEFTERILARRQQGELDSGRE